MKQVLQGADARIHKTVQDYRATLAAFATLGSKIYQINPREHYHSIGEMAKLPLEPGFVPIYAPPKLVAISYYPNESVLNSVEYAAHQDSSKIWGLSGKLVDYERAYRDWVRILPQVPFHRAFDVPVFSALGIADTEFAWLPLVKCPLPARTVVPDEDVYLDRQLLWDQLSLLRPAVILAQGLQAYEVVRPMCEDKFPHHLVLQRIGRVGTSKYHAEEDERVVRELRRALGAQS